MRNLNLVFESQIRHVYVGLLVAIICERIVVSDTKIFEFLEIFDPVVTIMVIYPALGWVILLLRSLINQNRLSMAKRQNYLPIAHYYDLCVTQDFLGDFLSEFLQKKI